MSKDIRRDDFTQTTKDIIAKKSGYICAYPNCKRMTVAGSNDRKSEITMTGVAAHITAASEDGPRWDEKMSPEERTSESNGSWTCQIHGKVIDDNPSKCTVEELHRWKFQNEKWVFERVESGLELFNNGVNKISFRNVGKFHDEYSISIGRHNIITGANESGKTTICQIVSAFSGGNHWIDFNKRFSFDKRATNRSFIEISCQEDHYTTFVKLSPQLVNAKTKRVEKALQRIHVEVNNCMSIDWPRSLFRTIYFNEQLCLSKKSNLAKAINYLASVLNIQEQLIWDALKEELFATSVFGYRFRRVGRRKVEILVPDGRTFYLPSGLLSSSELQIAYVDLALKLVLCTPVKENWIFIFDNYFFGRLDKTRKKYLFNKLFKFMDRRIQTLFCLHSRSDAEVLLDTQSDKWVNATNIEELTIHSFL